MASQDPQAQPFHWHYTELNDRDFQIRGRTVFFVIVLFAVVLLFSLLFMYARWVCRYYSHHIPSALNPSSPRAPTAGRPGGLDPARIRALPITLYKSSSSVGVSPNGDINNSYRRGGGGECCICLGGFEEGEKVKVLPKCGHCFHSECVDRWLVAQSSCPICRASLLDDSLLIAVVPVVTDQ